MELSHQWLNTDQLLIHQIIWTDRTICTVAFVHELALKCFLVTSLWLLLWSLSFKCPQTGWVVSFALLCYIYTQSVKICDLLSPIVTLRNLKMIHCYSNEMMHPDDDLLQLWDQVQILSCSTRPCFRFSHRSDPALNVFKITQQCERVLSLRAAAEDLLTASLSQILHINTWKPVHRSRLV